MSNFGVVHTNIIHEAEPPYTKLYNTSTLYDGNTGFSTLSEYILVDYPKRTLKEIILCAIFLFLIILMAFIGNIAVIYAAICTPQPREQHSNFFIINLAITDMSMSCVVMITSFVSLVADTIHIHPLWCNVVCATHYTLIIVSMLTLASISIDRWL